MLTTLMVMDIPSLLTPQSPSVRRQRLIEQRQRREKRADLSRDEKIEIRTLRKHTQWTYEEIARVTAHTPRQVQVACNSPLTPKKSRSGRRPSIRTPEKLRLEAWLLDDEIHR